MWILASIGSAFFAGTTSILSKCGLKKTDSDVATALRTTVVLLFSWLIALLTGAISGIGNISPTSWLFLILSGLATGLSWIFYFKALSLGEVSKVSAVDKSSLILSVLLALIIFPSERNMWWLKLILLGVIAIGTYMMIDIKKDEGKSRWLWLVFAIISAVFAATTSILAKIGIENVDSNLATAIRTTVVVIMAWLIVIGRKKGKYLKAINRKEALFLVLSGIATGLSWLCYYYALSSGQVSVVVPIDKLSILISVLFSYFFLKEPVSIKGWIGLFLIVIATISMALFT